VSPETVTSKFERVSPMLRSKIYWLAIALLATGATTACTRADVTGPSTEQYQPSFEKQGGNG
jgi:hypothetical protein